MTISEDLPRAERRPDDGSDDAADPTPIGLEPTAPAGPPDRPWTPPPVRDDWTIRTLIDAVVVAGICLFVFWQLHPHLLLRDTTPAGGDMGAHVWGFSYLRDTLLPSLRWSGWTPDWYNGFPAFQFYMVVPFLGMVLLNAGFSGALAAVPVVVAAGLVARGAQLAVADARSRDRSDETVDVATPRLAVGAGSGEVLLRSLGARWRWYVGAVAVVAVAVSAPFGVAFKLISVAGVVTMPAAAYAFGRLARFPFPTPALMAVGTCWFLFDKNFTIYGGNIASTLAGEFAFSISLSLAIAYLGVLAHGLRTGRQQALAAVLLALVGLCHLLPAFFAVGATVVFWAVHAVAPPVDEAPDERQVRLRRLVGLVVLLAVLGVLLGLHVVSFWLAGPVAALAVLAFGLVHTPMRSWWLTTVGATAGLLAAWWVLPFFWNRLYLNDMGWEKIAQRRPDMSWYDWFSGEAMQYLVPTGADEAPPDSIVPFAILALVGAVLSVVFRNRIGTALVWLGLGLAAAFMYVPDGRLWNARLLPFWYLVVYLLAAVAVGEIVRAVAQLLSNIPDRTVQPVTWVAAPTVALLLVLFIGAQTRSLPFGSTNDDGSYSVLGIADVNGRHFVQDWARWNYSGYEDEGKQYAEYAGLIQTMQEVADEHGCGRSLWEYHSDINDYGTPMAPMLLPHWTDGCIGSQEGLYFEASSTTPFHFLMQSELSQSPSRAQRDMPYREFDIDRGVEHLQLMGVRYYMTFKAESFEAARRHPDLELVGQSPPWSVFLVADAPIVEPLAFEPAVTTSGEHQHGDDAWLCASEEGGRCTGPALDWFQDADRWDVALTASGPGDWQRLDWGDLPERRAVPPATVSDIRETDDSLRFTVDRIGSPVLVKTSYFPHWSVSGADGPYRAAPNLMVVVPTDTEVVLTFDRTPIDFLAIVLTLGGIALCVLFVRRGAVPVRELRWFDGVDSWLTEPTADGSGTAEPREAEPREAEPGAAEPRAAEPGAAEPREAEPRAAEPREAETSTPVAPAPGIDRGPGPDPAP